MVLGLWPSRCEVCTVETGGASECPSQALLTGGVCVSLTPLHPARPGPTTDAGLRPRSRAQHPRCCTASPAAASGNLSTCENKQQLDPGPFDLTPKRLILRPPLGSGRLVPLIPLEHLAGAATESPEEPGDSRARRGGWRLSRTAQLSRLSRLSNLAFGLHPCFGAKTFHSMVWTGLLLRAPPPRAGALPTPPPSGGPAPCLHSCVSRHWPPRHLWGFQVEPQPRA